MVINLATRTDRRLSIENQLKGLDYQIIEGVTYDKATPFNFTNQGEYGCYLSHIKCLEYQKNYGKEVLILEDDVFLCDDFANKLQKYILNLPKDYFIAYLGTYKIGVNYDEKLSEDLIRVRKRWGAFGYIVNHDKLDFILDKAYNYRKAIDNLYKDIQKEYLCVEPNPLLAYTIDGYSNIRNNTYTYNAKEILSKKF